MHFTDYTRFNVWKTKKYIQRQRDCNWTTTNKNAVSPALLSDYYWTEWVFERLICIMGIYFLYVHCFLNWTIDFKKNIRIYLEFHKNRSHQLYFCVLVHFRNQALKINLGRMVIHIKFSIHRPHMSSDHSLWTFVS